MSHGFGLLSEVPNANDSSIGTKGSEDHMRAQPGVKQLKKSMQRGLKCGCQANAAADHHNLWIDQPLQVDQASGDPRRRSVKNLARHSIAGLRGVEE
jgi:hypothetical protein